MTLQPPTTKEDFIKVKETIIELMNNKYADKGMIEKLKVRLQKTEEKINLL